MCRGEPVARPVVFAQLRSQLHHLRLWQRQTQHLPADHLFFKIRVIKWVDERADVRRLTGEVVCEFYFGHVA